MDLAYPPRCVRRLGSALLIVGLALLGLGVGLLEFGIPNVEGPHFGPGILSAYVGTLLLVMGGVVCFLARHGRQRA